MVEPPSAASGLCALTPAPNADLLTAVAWLATDLDAICAAAAQSIGEGHFELVEDESGDHIEEMARLLRIDCEMMEDSGAQRFLVSAIHEWFSREMERRS